MPQLPTPTRRLTPSLLTVLLCTAGLALSPGAGAASAQSPSPSHARASGASPDAGLARTPPMGFNNWNATHCEADFNAKMVKATADVFVKKGLKKAGYRYINLDDCWAEQQRDADGKLVPHHERFPDGIKDVADYVHARGLKLGIYTSAGTKTCDDEQGIPGALGHEDSDARQFADWGVDYLKYDNCNNQGVPAKKRYRAMRDALHRTGRPIVYGICEWGENDPWKWAPKLGGQLWRTTDDIGDDWDSMLGIMKKNLPLARYAGPGHWNDPDMLEVGNGGMSQTEYRTHFSMWSMMAAPLLIGTDLRKASDRTLEILGNKEVIAVDQGPLGKQGTVVSSKDGRLMVSKPMADGSRAVALLNESEDEQRIATTADAVGLPDADSYTVRDLWKHRSAGAGDGDGEISTTVPAHGTALLRVSAAD